MALLRAAVIGVGSIGSQHARVLASLDGVVLVDVIDPAHQGTLVQGVQVRSEVPSDAERRWDYCVISVPTALHELVALEINRLGIPCLIEKPLAISTEAAATIVHAFAAKGLPGATGHVERFNPAVRESKRLIGAGELGDPIAITTRRHSQQPTRSLGTGVILDLATHDIDCTRWVLEDDYDQIMAASWARSRDSDAMEDVLFAIARMGSGCLAMHSVHWLSPQKERRIEILGSRGLLVADLLMADLSLHSHGTARVPWGHLSPLRGDREGSMIRFSFEKDEPLRLQHAAFRDLVLGKASDCASLEEGLAVVSTASRMFKDSRGTEASMNGQGLPAADLDSHSLAPHE